MIISNVTFSTKSCQLFFSKWQIQQKRCDDCGDTTITAEADLKVSKGRRDWHKKAHFGAVEDPCKSVMGDGSENDSDRLKDGVQKVADW